MVFLTMSVGLILLVFGADYLVKGASSLAKSLGISSLVIGLTIVAFGTSAPELTVSLMSALKGETDLAFGNVVGSNIFNILFILGISAVIVPLSVHRQIIRVETPIMIAAAFFVWWISSDLVIARWEGLVLFLGLVAYTYGQIHFSRKQKSSASDDTVVGEFTSDSKSRAKQITFIILGLLGLVAGSKLFVDGAVALATRMGVSELVIGLTIVAAGTSLPEVATSVMAALRNERDIAVGNVVGSCIFNILAVLGISASLSPQAIGIPETALAFDVPIMVAVSLACLPIFFTEYRIGRWEGLLFLGSYIIYTITLVLKAQGHALLPFMTQTTSYFLIPLAVLVIAASTLKFHKKNRSQQIRKS